MTDLGQSVDPAKLTPAVHADDGSPCASPAFCSRAHTVVRRRDHAGMPQGWRDVPMPPRVAALPRTRSGVPITYTVAWTSERETVLANDPDLAIFSGGPVLAIFSGGEPGSGEPKLGIVDTARARRATIKGLCQVCGGHLPGRTMMPWNTEPRWLGWFTKGQTINVGGRQVPLVIDGWTCKPCLDYALKVCPALVARSERGTLQLLRVRRAELVATYERPESMPADGFVMPGETPAEGKTVIPVGMMKIAPLDFDVLTPGEVLAGA